jgi:hypothetical protein
VRLAPTQYFLSYFANLGERSGEMSSFPDTSRVFRRNAMDKTALLSHVYERFNARDMETVLAAMHEDVTWANGMDGGYVNGKDEVRKYWTRQWGMVDPRVEPVEFSEGADGTISIRVHQVVHDLNGNLLADQEVRHIFSMEQGLIKRFDIG